MQDSSVEHGCYPFIVLLQGRNKSGQNLDRYFLGGEFFWKDRNSPFVGLAEHTENYYYLSGPVTPSVFRPALVLKWCETACSSDIGYSMLVLTPALHEHSPR